VLMFILTVVAMLVFAVLSPFIMGPGYTVPRIEVPLSPGEVLHSTHHMLCEPCLCLSFPAMGIVLIYQHVPHPVITADDGLSVEPSKSQDIVVSCLPLRRNRVTSSMTSYTVPEPTFAFLPYRTPVVRARSSASTPPRRSAWGRCRP
jgi:hypothetical protein